MNIDHNECIQAMRRDKLSRSQIEDRIEALERENAELVDALEKLLIVTRHLEPCFGTVDEVEGVLAKVRTK